MNRYLKKITGTAAALAILAGSFPAAAYADDSLILAEEEMILQEDAAETEILPESGKVEAQDPDTEIALPEVTETPAETAEEENAEKEPTFSIGAVKTIGSLRPEKTAVTKVSVGTKRLTVKWTPLTGQVDAYQVQYSTKKDFSSGKKTVKVSGDTSSSLVIKNLTSGKRYYIRVRSFKKIGGKRYFSKWSDVRSAKLTYNSIRITGSSDSKTIWLYNPKKSIKSLKIAVWTEDNGQDDLTWYSMKKTSTGTWKAAVDLLRLLHDGTTNVHVYTNTDTFIGAKTFKAPPMGFPICSSEEEYIERIAPAVQAACAKYGYLPSVLIAQSCLENGYGIPSYWDNPQISALLRYNNMVGLKSSLLNSSWYDKTVWPGKSIVKKTPEEYDGVPVIITDSFRVYDNIQQSFEDFLLFLTYASNYGYGGTPKYGPAVLSIKNPGKLIKAVASRGYATGSTYADSVMRIINKHNLTKYD